jgi:hypothetical protein
MKYEAKQTLIRCLLAKSLKRDREANGKMGNVFRRFPLESSASLQEHVTSRYCPAFFVLFGFLKIS